MLLLLNQNFSIHSLTHLLVNGFKHHITHINGGTPLRMNFAAVGYTYDKENDVFISPKPFGSWILDETIYDWKAPVDKPDDGKRYDWDEPTTSWVERT